VDDLVITQGLTKRFDGLIAVDDVEFHVKEGQAVGVIGPNGSGKTTLFNLLSGYFPPSEGQIFFSGKNITKVPPHRRVGMGMARTFQLVSVFDQLRVWENLILSNIKSKTARQSTRDFFFAPAPKTAMTDSCQEALRMVGLGEKSRFLTAELSYGDKRMLEIAVGLSLKPRLLLLDEPLAGLSDHEIGEVLNLINRVKENFTLVIIEHKISKILDLVQKLFVMNEGRIICEGDPVHVLSDSAVKECYWGKEEENCSR